MNHINPALLWPAAALLILAASSAAAVEATARNAALSSITSEEIKHDVDALADDTFEGREAGSRGNRAAGIYMIERLKKIGLTGGAANGSFYQNFEGYGNILALVEGGDPALKDQVIVISAHFDHVGYGNRRNSNGPVGLIHNGADDNASGVAGLLEVAEAVSRLPEKPNRSILFAFWDGEEKGLLGSKHWLDHPTVALARVPIMLNVDMIGRLRDSWLVVYGTRTSRGLRRTISRQNDPSQLQLNFTWEIKGDSDHYGFYSRGIPFIMMHTGLHGDYHRPSDDADKINAEGLKQVAQLMFGVLVDLADAPSLAGFRGQSRNESRADELERARGLPPLPGRLGIRIDGKAAGDGRVVVSGVTSGSAADKAGLRMGDRLLTWAGRDIDDPARFPSAVLSAKSPVAVTVERAGKSEPISVEIELPADPVRLGISWRTDDTEPGAVIVNRVISGSPAELAGLRVNDRIYSIAGREFGDGEEFRRLVGEFAEGFTLEVETVGRLHTVEIPAVKTP